MKRLILLRHAEAESPSSGPKDFERRLTPQGRVEAIEAAGTITRAGLQIEAALVSPARRSGETIDIIAAALSIGQITYEPALYLGAPDALLQVLQRCGDSLTVVMVLAHNPGISELAQYLSAQAQSQSIALRTAGLCCLNLPQRSWRDIGAASASSFSLLR